MGTPCIKLCKLNNGVCIGCGRTIIEITQWPHLTHTERTKIMIRLKKKDKKVTTLKEAVNRFGFSKKKCKSLKEALRQIEVITEASKR